MQTFTCQFVALHKINSLTLRRFEQASLLLSGFTFEVVQISPADSGGFRLGPGGTGPPNLAQAPQFLIG